MKPTHTHRAKAGKSKDICFNYPVANPGNPKAHGGITRIDTCTCGAVRRTNINGSHIERGPWI